MAEVIEWLMQSGEDLTVIMLLLIVLFAVVFGVQQPSGGKDSDGIPNSDRWGRPWWVPGWVYRSEVERRVTLQKEVERYVTQTEERLKTLEDVQQQSLRQNNERGRG